MHSCSCGSRTPLPRSLERLIALLHDIYPAVALRFRAIGLEEISTDSRRCGSYEPAFKPPLALIGQFALPSQEVEYVE